MLYIVDKICDHLFTFTSSSLLFPQTTSYSSSIFSIYPFSFITVLCSVTTIFSLFFSSLNRRGSFSSPFDPQEFREDESPFWEKDLSYPLAKLPYGKSTILALSLFILMCEFWEMLEMDMLDSDESRKKKGCSWACSCDGFRDYCLVMCSELFVVDYFSYFWLFHSVWETIMTVSSWDLAYVAVRQNFNAVFLPSLSFQGIFSTPCTLFSFSFSFGVSSTLYASLFSMPFIRASYSLSNLLIQFYIFSWDGTSMLVSSRSYFSFWNVVLFPFNYFIPIWRQTFSWTILRAQCEGARYSAQFIWLRAYMVLPAFILSTHLSRRASLLLKQYSMAFQTQSKFSSRSALSRQATERQQHKFLKAEGRSPYLKWSAKRLQQAW